MSDIVISMVIFVVMFGIAFVLSYMFFDNDLRITLIFGCLMVSICCFLEILADFFLTIDILLLILITYSLFNHDKGE